MEIEFIKFIFYTFVFIMFILMFIVKAIPVYGWSCCRVDKIPLGTRVFIFLLFCIGLGLELLHYRIIAIVISVLALLLLLSADKSC